MQLQFIFLFMLLLGSCTQLASAIGGWNCEVCQDVVSTFRSSFPNLGARSLAEPIERGGSAGMEGPLLASSPGCHAFPAASTARTTCITQRSTITKDKSTREGVLDAFVTGEEPFNVCGTLGKCPLLPVAQNAAEIPPSDQETLACYHASKTQHCDLHPLCSAMRKHCHEECTTCIWLMKSWPKFSGSCSTQAQQIAKSAQQTPTANTPQRSSNKLKPNTGSSGKFRQVESENVADSVSGVTDIFMDSADNHHNNNHHNNNDNKENTFLDIGSVALATATAAPAKDSAPALTDSLWRSSLPAPLIPKGSGSPDLSAAATADVDEELKQATCYKMWNAISAVPELWAAVTAEDSRLMYPWDSFTMCRCLSQCPYNSIDSLAVHDACTGLSQPYAIGLRSLERLSRKVDAGGKEPAAEEEIAEVTRLT